MVILGLTICTALLTLCSCTPFGLAYNYWFLMTGWYKLRCHGIGLVFVAVPLETCSCVLPRGLYPSSKVSMAACCTVGSKRCCSYFTDISFSLDSSYLVALRCSVHNLHLTILTEKRPGLLIPDAR
ncbi:hypothetical protein K440DRAFT_148513 [Wilcoxina mikolae CBS 423.85]|nr:hypothetical protein K440DRAFT_148513 [Wilcoxina mikolae CBS 423.85]